MIAPSNENASRLRRAYECRASERFQRGTSRPPMKPMRRVVAVSGLFGLLVLASAVSSCAESEGAVAPEEPKAVVPEAGSPRSRRRGGRIAGCRLPRRRRRRLHAPRAHVRRGRLLRRADRRRRTLRAPRRVGLVEQGRLGGRLRGHRHPLGRRHLDGHPRRSQGHPARRGRSLGERRLHRVRDERRLSHRRLQERQRDLHARGARRSRPTPRTTWGRR